jgi:hypothetical protein
VTFIDRELGLAPGRTISAPSAQGANLQQIANANVVAPPKTPFARLQKYLAANIPHGLIDLRKSHDELARGP